MSERIHDEGAPAVTITVAWEEGRMTVYADGFPVPADEVPLTVFCSTHYILGHSYEVFPDEGRAVCNTCGAVAPTTHGDA